MACPSWPHVNLPWSRRDVREETLEEDMQIILDIVIVVLIVDFVSGVRPDPSVAGHVRLVGET